MVRSYKKINTASCITLLLIFSMISKPMRSFAQESSAPAALKLNIAAPKFLREGDRIKLLALIQNTSDKEISGQIELQVIDPKTKTSADGWFRNFFPNQYFSAAPRSTTPTEFYIEVPYEYNHDVSFKLFAKSDPWTDSIEHSIPVLADQTTTLIHANGIRIQTEVLKQEKNKKQSLQYNGTTIHVGDTILTKIHISGLIPNKTYILEANKISAFVSLDPTTQQNELNNAAAHQFIKTFQSTSSKTASFSYSSVVQFSGSFIQSTLILKNKEGKILHASISMESIHVE